MVHGLYYFSWMNILRNKENCYKSEDRLILFGEISSDFFNAMDALPAEKIEHQINVEELPEYIQRIAFSLGGGENKIELLSAYSLAGSIGNYLLKQQKKGNLIDFSFWGKPIRRWSFSVANIQDIYKKDYEKSRSILLFNYCRGFLIRGMGDVVKENLYYYNLNNLYHVDSPAYVFSILLIHCYMYYLAEREGTECIDEYIKNNIKAVLRDTTVKQRFTCFLSHLSDHPELLSEGIEGDIAQVLDRYELFPKYEDSKYMIMDDVTRDFYLFIILFISIEYYFPNLVDRYLKVETYLNYMYENAELDIKEKLKVLSEMVADDSETDEKIMDRVNDMYDLFMVTLKKKYKEQLIVKADEMQESYCKSVNEKELCEKIRTLATERFKEKFNSILVAEDNDNPIIKMNIFRLNNYTDSINEDFRHSFYSDMFGNFALRLENYLYKQNVVAVKNRRTEFLDDDSYMNFLEDNELQLLIGSRYVLANRNYRMKSKFEEFIEPFDCIYTTLIKDGIAVKKNSIKICLHDVKVTIHSPKINEESITFNESTGKYQYSPLNGVALEFDKKEMKKFIFNYRKIINITLYVSIRVNGDDIGYIIQDKV